MHAASLNHQYRLVWNETRQTFVAVAETTRGRGKRGRSGLSAAVVLAGGLMAATTGSAAAGLPTGGQISAGQGSIARSGNTLTVTQISSRLAADWQSFSIGAGHSVNYVQPSATAVALNRVLGSEVSVIQGALTANGLVFLVNPNGVLFTPTAQVNVGGLVASTLDLSNADFMAGTFRFAGSAVAAVRNEGQINAPGGSVALIAARIENIGQITADGGNVLMGAGQRVRLDLGGPVKIEVEEGALNALIVQGGGIRADGGHVLLTAQAAGDLASSVINHTGITEARTLAGGSEGRIELMGDLQRGSVRVAGTLDASAPFGGQGGFIETSAAHVKVADSARITTAAAQGRTGSWLLDPNDFTIAASGGDMTGTALGTALGSTNVTLQSVSGATSGNGDIFVNDAVTWNAATRLTLSAQRNIEINADISAQHANGQVQLAYGQDAINAGNTASYRINGGRIHMQAGDNFFTRLGNDGAVDTWTVITALGSEASVTGTDLQGMNGNPAGKYALGADIDAASTSAWNSGAGFAPISTFTGQFDGLGHTVSHLTINRPSENEVGLFGFLVGGTIRNVGAVGGNVSGSARVGGLAGFATANSSISNSFATGNVSGDDLVGGLVGATDGSSVSNSWASGAIVGGTYSGGLVGWNTGGSSITNSYSAGTVGGQPGGGNRLGGFVGVNEGSISDSYSTASITNGDPDFFGGLVGLNTGSITRSYAVGMVSVQDPNNYAGALVGYNAGGAISNSYWNSDTATASGLIAGGIGGGNTGGAIGLTTGQMQQSSSFTGFNFTTTPGATGNNWVIVNGDRSLNGLGAEGGGSTPMLSFEHSTTVRNAHQLQLMAMNLAGAYVLAADINAASTAGPGDVWGSAGFVPVGLPSAPFRGRFDGMGHTVSNLTINRSASDYTGLFGAVSGGDIRNVGLVDGSVSGAGYVGALAGYTDNATISNSYATGSVSALSSFAGGLVGFSDGGTIDRSYATGSVSGGNAGGLVGGSYQASVDNSFWDTQTSGQSTSAGGTGKTTAQMQNFAIFDNAGWDVQIDAGYAGSYLYPRLSTAGGSPVWLSNPATLTFTLGPLTGPYVYAGSTYNLSSLWSASSVFGTDYSALVAGTDYTFQYGGGAVTGFTNAGTYSGIGISVLKPGYLLAGSSNTTGSLTIAKANLSLSGSRVYDGSTVLAGSVLTATGVNGETFSVSGAGANGNLSSKHVQTNQAMAGLSGLSLGSSSNGGLSSNYNALSVSGSQVSLTAKPVTLTAPVLGKTYDGTLAYTTQSAELTALSAQLGVPGDTVNAITLAYTDKNAGAASKTVNASAATVDDGNSGGNYALSYASNAVSTISKANATVTANSGSGVYSGVVQSVSGFTAGGLVNGETTAVLSGVSTTGGTGTNAGSYAHTASGTDGNYNLSFTEGALTIAKANATVTANSGGGVYSGVAQSVTGFTASGLVNGETTAVLSGVSTSGGSGTNAGSFAHTATGTDGNYDLSFINGALTIARANAMVTANSGSGVYSGTAQSVSGFTASGLVNGETGTVLSGVSTAGGSGINAGSYAHTASGTDGNYNLSFTDGALTIAKANATVTANSGGGVYSGMAQSVTGFTASGLVNGETTAVLSGVSTSGGTGTNAGNYTHIASGTDANYDLSFVNGVLTLARANATVTANSGSGVYNGTPQSVIGFSAGGLVNGETTAVLSGVTTAGGTGTNSGSYAHIASGTDANYNLSFNGGNLTIAKANATVTANSGSGVYNGTPQSVNGFTAGGLVNGETTAVLIGVSTAGGTGTNAGSYSHTASGSAGNYNLNFTNGALTITKADAAVIANSASSVYSGMVQSVGGFTASGLVNGETAAVLSGVSSTGGRGTNAGSYALTANGTDGNYNLSFTDGALTIAKANATVTANSGSGVYSGVAQSVTGFTASGLVNGETTAVLSGVSTSGGSGTNAGRYAHTANGTDGNYNLSFTDGALTIAKANATVTANSGGGVYSGMAQSVTGFTASGLVDGETTAVLSGVSTRGGSGSNSGRYAHTANGTDGNYNLSFTDGALTIAKANATVTANSGSGVYSGTGQSVTGFTASGLVNGETATVLGGVSTSGGTGTNAGSYTHVASGMDANYDLSFVNGVLTIAKATATVTANSGKGAYSGAPQSVTGFTASGLVNGETAAVLSGVSTSGGSGTNAGSYSHMASGTDANYALSFNDGKLTIRKADATVTANSGSGVYNGTLQSVNGFTVSGLVNGETTAVLSGVSTAGGFGTNAGSYTHSASGADANYTLSFVNGVLTIRPFVVPVTVDAPPVYSLASSSLIGSISPNLPRSSAGGLVFAEVDVRPPAGSNTGGRGSGGPSVIFVVRGGINSGDLTPATSVSN